MVFSSSKFELVKISRNPLRFSKNQNFVKYLTIILCMLVLNNCLLFINKEIYKNDQKIEPLDIFKLNLNFEEIDKLFFLTYELLLIVEEKNLLMSKLTAGFGQILNFYGG